MQTDTATLKAIQGAISECFRANREPLSVGQIKAWIAAKYVAQHFDEKAVHGQIRGSCINKFYTRLDRRDTPKILYFDANTRTYRSLEGGVSEGAGISSSPSIANTFPLPVSSRDLEKNALIYERQLQEALTDDLSQIEDGLTLWKTEPPSVEFVLTLDEDLQRRKRIDILAKDANGTPVIVELKLNRAHDKVVGQALLYRALLKKKLRVARIRIILIAYEISDELYLTCSEVNDVTLCEYKVRVNVTRIYPTESSRADEAEST